MAGSIRSYENLAVWQEAMQLVEMTYGLIRRLPSAERYSMSPQMARAAVSIPANIAEGHGSGLRRVYLYHLTMGRGSLAELETYLGLVFDWATAVPSKWTPRANRPAASGGCSTG